jgi:phosphoribosyl-AMP cyclohydrolase
LPPLLSCSLNVREHNQLCNDSQAFTQFEVRFACLGTTHLCCISAEFHRCPPWKPLKVLPVRSRTLLWGSRKVPECFHQTCVFLPLQGFSDRDAISATLDSKRATFYSRSRKQLWTKGETSSNFINVTDVYIDCDRDSVIYSGKPDGPTCHTGADTCYFTRIEEIAENGAASQSEVSTWLTCCRLDVALVQGLAFCFLCFRVPASR